MGDIVSDDGLTIVKVRDGFQDATIGVDRLWPTGSAGGVPVRVQDHFGVDEIPGRDPLVQSLAKSSGSGHICRSFERIPLYLYDPADPGLVLGTSTRGLWPGSTCSIDRDKVI